MDHLRTPHIPTYQARRAPLVCSKLDNGAYWDDKDFLAYPSRAGEQWKHFTLQDELSYRYQYLESKSPSPTRELEVFLQRWLWFGLLYATFSQDGLYREADWVEEINGASHITSKPLPQVLRNYEVLVSQMASETKVDRCRRLHTCLRRVFYVLWVLRAGSGSHYDFDPAIRTSLIILYDQLNSAWDKLYSDVSELAVFTPIMDALGSFSEEESSRMRNHSWCPSLIKSEGSIANSPELRQFETALQQYPAVSHADCDDETCLVECIDRNYRPKHTSDDCHCNLVGPDLAEVEAILKQGNYPILMVSGNDTTNIAVDVLPCDATRPYVAISHVWAQGMGNPQGLELPACQIVRMQRAVEGIIGKTFIWPEDQKITEKGPLYLWCDSLLCPVVPEPPEDMDKQARSEFTSSNEVKRAVNMKREALNHMRAVYTDAKYVLILDTGLEAVDYTAIGDVEAGVRILTSQWVQRLWTYQEAALPIKLLVQFKDTVVDYRDLASNVRELYRHDIVHRPLTFALLTRLLQLRALRYQAASAGADLLSFTTAFAKRRYTFEMDVPLCAAVLFGIDVAEIAAAHTIELRMVAFWQAFAKLHPIPHNIVFMDSARLPIPGFRWSPASIRDYFIRLADSQPSRLTPKGLIIKVTSWSVKQNVLPWVAKGFLMQGLVEGRTLLWAHNPTDRQWYKMSCDDGPDEQKFWRLWVTHPGLRCLEWRVLFENAFNVRSTSKAVLCLVDRSQADFPVLKCSLTLHVNKVIGDELVIQQAAYEKAQALRTSSALRRYQEVFLRDTIFGVVRKGWPQINKLRMTGLIYSLHLWLARYHAGQVFLKLMEQRQPDAWSSELTQAIENTRSLTETNNDTWLGANMVVIFHAQYATITEETGEREWCVD